MKKIFVYVQHLLGVGHLHRTALITKALTNHDLDVTLVSGGTPEAQADFGHVNFIQLPAIKTDSEFTNLYDENGQVISDEFKQSRQLKLISAYNQVKPDFVLIETYPFGRRQMKFELLPLLQEINKQNSARPIVACSIRDVIQPKSRQKRVDEIVKLIANYFDAILVHGDKNFIEFRFTFPAAKKFNNKLFYTGYVTKPVKKANRPVRQKNYILVSAGGGAVGQKLYQTVVNASKQGKGQLYQWHVLVGDGIAEQEFIGLLSQQSDNLMIERNRKDFLDLMANCSISISQAGYNTIMDILVTGTPSVVIPFEGEAEQEQLIRATALEKKGLVTILREQNLAETELLNTFSQLRFISNDSSLSIQMNGDMHTVSLIKQMLSSKTRL